MSRRHRYPLGAIKRDYTYAVCEIARLFDITRDTVFCWIRDEGLQRLQGSRKYLVHSSDLTAFLTVRNRKNKKPCRAGEMYCCKCRRPRTPDPTLLKVEPVPNGTVRAQGLCINCGTRVNKVIRGSEWSETHRFYASANASTAAHNGAHRSPRKCQS
jgi:hypothetical protein